MRKMELPKLIEELYAMLESNQNAVCSIEYKELRRSSPFESHKHIQSACLEDAIPLLFQADIDQFVITDLFTEVYALKDFPSCSNYYIHIKLTRCI